MQVILLERIENLGQMGDEVKVKNGFARNYLLPQNKALRANDINRKVFAAQRAQLEADNLKRKSEAEAVAEKLDGQTFTLIRQAGDRGQLYGSVSTRDIAEAITAGGFTVGRHQVPLDRPIKDIGLVPMTVILHPEVKVSVTINVARNEHEAERQALGEDVLTEEVEAERAEDDAAAAAFAEGVGDQDEDEVSTEETAETEAPAEEA